MLEDRQAEYRFESLFRLLEEIFGMTLPREAEVLVRVLAREVALLPDEYRCAVEARFELAAETTGDSAMGSSDLLDVALLRLRYVMDAESSSWLWA